MTRSPGKSSVPGSEPFPFKVEVRPAVRRAVESEAAAWEAEHGTRSQLRAELEALGELLAVHPLISWTAETPQCGSHVGFGLSFGVDIRRIDEVDP